MPTSTNPSGVYYRVLEEIFSGRIAPGSKLVEQKLADQLGVSRVPIRETLVKLVGQGILVGGKKGHGVHVREYALQEVRDLYQFRESIESGAAKAAASAANRDDLLVLEMICEQMDEVADKPSSRRWADLDHRFHQAIAGASHNERFIHEMKTLLDECHYVFFGPGPKAAVRFWLDLSEEEIRANHHQALVDHRQLVAALQQRDSAEAQRIACEHMSKSADRIMRSRIAQKLTPHKTSERPEYETKENRTESLEISELIGA